MHANIDSPVITIFVSGMHCVIRYDTVLCSSDCYNYFNFCNIKHSREKKKKMIPVMMLVFLLYFLGLRLWERRKMIMKEEEMMVK